jgi:clan AA aspartic protease (TIGR02281 family)
MKVNESMLQYSALLLLLCSTCAIANELVVYRCVDKTGRVLYSDIGNEGCRKIDSVVYSDQKPASIKLRRGRDGHFSVSGLVAGVPVRFMVDTGATAVVVPDSVAALGRLSAGKPTMVQTAGGRRLAQRYDGVNIAVGALGPVQATVVSGLSGGGTNDALLGQSFLQNFDMHVIGDEMTLSRRK